MAKAKNVNLKKSKEKSRNVKHLKKSKEKTKPKKSKFHQIGKFDLLNACHEIKIQYHL